MNRNHLRRNRAVWDRVSVDHTDAEAAARWSEHELAWGLFRIPERDIGALGEVDGLDVVELGCGTAFVSAHLTRLGAHPVAVDLSAAQLASARRCQVLTGTGFPLVEACAEDVPLKSRSFDLVVSEYGAAPWCAPERWLSEAARLLRPGGRLVFLTNSPLAGMCVPAEGGVAGDRLLRPQRALARIEWPGGGVEHHPGHGDWVRALHDNGFHIDALHELHPDPSATTPDYYDIVTAEWARSWPAEDMWVATLSR